MCIRDSGDTDDVDFKRRLNGMSEADKKLVQERLEALLHHGLQLIRRDEPERRTLLSSSERLGRDGIYRDAAVGWGEAQRRLSLIHISEPTRLLSISYAVFCLKKKKKLYISHL
eukprot:TRINITY_DN51309_c0_g1_i1.p1 TRINITY_DN51309_c0_g1~~TRINITY_DN51309_c0_g1_i1.p1  ORF type:complete len:114 (+),score=30.67 TRINITY_DN51309_c0_g1_i1:138-479(+)